MAGTIKKIYKLNDEIKSLAGKESELYIKAQENKETVHKIKTSDGKVTEFTEGDMWEEVRVVGLNGKASKKLQKIYPEVFKIAKKREAKNAELQKFIIEELGFDFRQMNIADYLKLTELVIEEKLKKLNK